MAKRAGTIVGRILGSILILALLVVAGLAYLHRQDISDHFAAQSFQASVELTELTDSLQLTDRGRRVFFATHPTLEASQRFNDQCADVEHSEEGHILGCFTDDSIHLFQVTDERLFGIVQVTAAHELLHAAWSRLGESERNQLITSLTELYDELSQEDPQLAARMSVYSSLSRSGFANELHSVFGTEVRDLPAWLDEHYARWLSDRRIILDYFDAYHGIFEEIQDQADALQQQLAQLRERVEARRDAYDAAVAQFNADVQDFNARNQAFEFSGNEAEFWRLRGELEARAQYLNSERDGIQADIDRYEELREQLQELSATNQELNQHLDSNLAPPVAPSPVS